ncbi:unnamed protein product [Acanthosepion pharaonis]|uniref:Uncharacterized protein n=1 Tax=Acanthosepion pharaonis TaxID=158019 RepID=A0A812DSS3_ACAPH|nr:unnamed protein product [Sepia pharaonis]
MECYLSPFFSLLLSNRLSLFYLSYYVIFRPHISPFLLFPSFLIICLMLESVSLPSVFVELTHTISSFFVILALSLSLSLSFQSTPSHISPFLSLSPPIPLSFFLSVSRSLSFICLMLESVSVIICVCRTDATISSFFVAPPLSPSLSLSLSLSSFPQPTL